MKKSTKFLMVGLFLILALFTAGEIFQAVGLDFGLSAIVMSAIAGIVGGFKLIHGS